MILERDSFARLWGPGRGGGGADPTRDSLLGPAHARWRTQGDELLAGARNLDVGSIWSPASSVEAGEVAEVMEILNAAGREHLVCELRDLVRSRLPAGGRGQRVRWAAEAAAVAVVAWDLADKQALLVCLLYSDWYDHVTQAWPQGWFSYEHSR